MQLPRHRLLALLDECTGDDLWSLEHCRLRRVPDAWIADLADAFESGFRSDSQTIYQGDRPINQYEGIRDVDLALQIAKSLGMDAEHLRSSSVSRRAIVQSIKQAVMEGDI